MLILVNIRDIFTRTKNPYNWQTTNYTGFIDLNIFDKLIKIQFTNYLN